MFLLILYIFELVIMICLDIKSVRIRRGGSIYMDLRRQHDVVAYRHRSSHSCCHHIYITSHLASLRQTHSLVCGGDFFALPFRINFGSFCRVCGRLDDWI